MKAQDTATALSGLSAELEKLVQVGLDRAKSTKADAAKFSASCAFERRLVVENKEFTLANSLESQKIGLVVHKDKKKGSAQINTKSGKAVEKAVDDALALAAFSVPDDALTMASLQDAPRAKQLPFMFDAELSNIELGELQEIMQIGLSAAIKDKRVALDKFDLGCNVSWSGLANSNGVVQAEKQTMVTWSFFGMAVDGPEVSGFDYDVGFAWRRKGLEDRLIQSAQLFAERVTRNLRPQKCPSYRGPVIFSPRAVEDLLVGMILYHASGSAVMDGKSQWTKSVGADVLSQLFTLTDDPHSETMSGATAFDGDGLPTKAQKIVGGGKLLTHLHDLYTARRTGAKSTAMSGGPFALTVAGGSAKFEDLASARGEILLVDRFSGNSDPVKGDFSGVAKNSRLYRGGKDAGSVAETMIAGNFFDIAKQLLQATRDTEVVQGSFVSPWILVDGVSVTGAS
jgi:PmbA protein